MKSNLSLLKPGESGIVKSVAHGSLHAKLVEMGVYKGKKIKVLFRAPFGDPIAVDVEGYILSLRMDEARIVSLEPSAA